MNRAGKLIGLSWAHSRGILGQGIGVAVMDTGICRHNDFFSNKDRTIIFKDFLNGRDNCYDDNGHGSHVCGILGGNGTMSNGLYTGVAPGCNLIVLKVLNKQGNGNVPDVLAGLQWIIENKEKYNIRIVNISVGTSKAELAHEDSILVKGVNDVWDHNIIVVTAAGNGGPSPQSIGAPGISRKIITVGACDDENAFTSKGTTMHNYSGRGPTLSCIKKPDIVAPGSNIVSCNLTYPCHYTTFPIGFSSNKQFSESSSGNQQNLFSNMYVSKSGTSMSTPMVSGAIALLLSIYPEMTNREVKVRLKNNAVDLGLSHERQGWGKLDIPLLLK